ncbi:phosphatidylinositol-3-phosphatase SAC1 [Culicoides brevitarsis]|uniref:phosphatidylinositol-3-phosphatase SAC1 n=1 Tax=Culicoides brevitarsis TaxID=469753 RepID=UPI00307B98D5
MAFIHDDMNFYTTPDKFYVEPNGKSEVLVIDRISHDVSLMQGKTAMQIVPPGTSQTLRKVCGILGVIRVTGGQYLVVATHRVFVGYVNQEVVWRLAGFDLVAYHNSLTHLNEAQKAQNDTYLDMVRHVLDTPSFYFSYTYDLSHTQQRLHANSTSKEFKELGLAERADERFVFNRHLLKSFLRSELRQYCLPLILGFVSIHQVNVNGHYFSWILISRRSIERAGPRLFSRGIDNEGHVSNYVETEQIVEYDGDRVSFVQTRGSIPLFWRQDPNLKYKPKPKIDYSKDHQTACQRHFNQQVSLYGKQVLVNLIDHRGSEEALEKAYRSIVAETTNEQNVRYEAFDFHTECRKMRWDRLNILIDRLAHEQDQFGVFHIRKDSVVLSSQTGVFRTNCIDCLDRTNVVQSMLARRSLQNTLTKLGILVMGQRIENTFTFENLFRNVWADNADLISTQYSGTGALKTDFTRTGKRTILGALRDGLNSMTRYYKNNFIDGFRQDSFDLFLGHYVVGEGEGLTTPSPLVSQKGWKYGTFPAVLLVAVAMFFASSVLPHEYNTENLLFLLFWGSMVGVTGYGIIKNGIEFVDWPKLVPPPKETGPKNL